MLSKYSNELVPTICYLPDDMIKELKVKARAEKTTRSDIIRRSIAKYMQ